MSRRRSPESTASFGIEARRSRRAGCCVARCRNAHERDMVLGDLQEQLAAPRHGAGTGGRRSPSRRTRSLRRTLIRRRTPRSGDSFMRTGSRTCATRGAALFKRPLLTAHRHGARSRSASAPTPPSSTSSIGWSCVPTRSSIRIARVLLAETGPRLEYRKESVSLANFLDWRTSADTIDPPVRHRLVGRQPRRSRRSRTAAGLPRVVRTSSTRSASGPRSAAASCATTRRSAAITSSSSATASGSAASTATRRSSDGAIIVDGEPHQVVGVAPPRFAFPDGAQIWAPLAFDPKQPPARDAPLPHGRSDG